MTSSPARQLRSTLQLAMVTPVGRGVDDRDAGGGVDQADGAGAPRWDAVPARLADDPWSGKK